MDDFVYPPKAYLTQIMLLTYYLACYGMGYPPRVYDITSFSSLAKEQTVLSASHRFRGLFGRVEVDERLQTL